MCASELIPEVVEDELWRRRIPRKRAEIWMQSDDLEILGLLVHAVTDRGVLERVQPPLDTQKVYDLLLTYFERCIREDPQGYYADGRYIVGHLITCWYHSTPESDDPPRFEFLVRIKEMLTRLYLEGDEDVHDAIVCGALEHILEQPRWREFFKDWCDHSVLREAYDRALEWSLQ